MFQLATWFFVAAIAALASPKTTCAQSQAEGRKLYLTYCAACHGDAGKGDGPAARSLPVKPADHTSGAEMNPLSDRFLREIILKGGSAVGRSSMMPAWGGQFNDKQVRDVIAYLKSIAQPPYRASGR